MNNIEDQKVIHIKRKTRKESIESILLVLYFLCKYLLVFSFVHIEVVAGGFGLKIFALFSEGVVHWSL